MNEKARQRNDLILELGLLVQPIAELAEAENPPFANDYRIACAKIQNGDAKWRESARRLSTFAPDIFLQAEFQNLSHAVERFLQKFKQRLSSVSQNSDRLDIRAMCATEIDNLKEDDYSCLSTIPIEWESEIFSANTPFTAYLKIKEAIASTTSRVYYFDRYLKPQFFEMFLRDSNRSLKIRLITTEGNNSYGINAVRAVSELARVEFDDYKLIQVVPNDMHDRNLIVDSNVFSLGPGVDRAGIALTNFSVSENSTEAQAELEKLLDSGTIIHES
jgi:hypothetical protein